MPAPIVPSSKHPYHPDCVCKTCADTYSSRVRARNAHYYGHDEDPLAPARGVIVGLALSVLIIACLVGAAVVWTQVAKAREGAERATPRWSAQQCAESGRCDRAPTADRVAATPDAATPHVEAANHSARRNRTGQGIGLGGRLGHSIPGLARSVQPIRAPQSLLRARQACPNTATLIECRGELRKAYAALEWGKHERLSLAREMVGKLSDWSCIHQREGAWNANTGNGYHGGLQMDWGFMRTYGRDMLQRHAGRGAETWTPREQIIVAQRAFAQGRGYAPWPATSKACGLR